MDIQQPEPRTNRTLGILLACTAGAMLAAVFGIVILVRYAEIHHLLVVL